MTDIRGGIDKRRARSHLRALQARHACWIPIHRTGIIGGRCAPCLTTAHGADALFGAGKAASKHLSRYECNGEA